MNTRNLGGHSGCKILLCEENDNKVFVRKISSNYEYNERLKVQAFKQESFATGQVKTPKVYAKGYTQDGLFYFDMEYIQGITMAEYMNTIEIGKVKNLVESLVTNILSPNSDSTAVDEAVFYNKISSLKEKLSNDNNYIIDEAIEMLNSHSWKNFPKTFCHGDMTLENIIVKDGQMYLIDFLDSFYDCWIMDISTLLQDVQTLWSYRNQKEINVNTLIRLMVFRDILIDTMNKMSSGIIVEAYYALLLKLIRIYPYTHDALTYEFLNRKTASVMRIIRNGGNL